MSFTNKSYDDCPNSVFPSNYDFTDDEFMMDLAPEDWAKIKDYETALNNGDENAANKHYNSIEKVERKIFSAVKWNKLRDSIRSCQKYFIEEIDGLIQGLNNSIISGYTALENKIKNILNKRGTYSPNETYNLGDIITYVIDDDTYSFICTINNTTNIPPTNLNNWTPLSIKGEPGEYNPRGFYDNNEAYNKYDCVLYNGINYVAIETTTGVTPDSDTNKWIVFMDGTNAATFGGKTTDEFLMKGKSVSSVGTPDTPISFAFGQSGGQSKDDGSGYIHEGTIRAASGAIAIGYAGESADIFADGNGAIAIGYADSSFELQAIGVGSVAIGSDNRSCANHSVAIGNNNAIDSDNSVVFGNDLYSNHTYQTILGVSNDNKEENIFELGNHGVNAIEVNRNGDMNVQGNITENGKQLAEKYLQLNGGTLSNDDGSMTINPISITANTGDSSISGFNTISATFIEGDNIYENGERLSDLYSEITHTHNIEDITGLSETVSNTEIIIRANDTPVNVKCYHYADYVCNGINDSEIIQQAVNNSYGATVLFLPGTYNINSTVNINTSCTIKGSGIDNTNIRQTSTNTIFNVNVKGVVFKDFKIADYNDSNSVGEALFGTTNADGFIRQCTWRDLNFSLNNTLGTKFINCGLNFCRLSDLIFNITFDNENNETIYLTDSDGFCCLINNCIVTNTGAFRITFRNSSVQALVRIRDNYRTLHKVDGMSWETEDF